MSVTADRHVILSLGAGVWPTRLANPPVFVKESVEYTAFPHPEHQARFEAYLIRRGEIPRFVTMPLFARAFTGARPAMLRRQCTGDYKLEARAHLPLLQTADRAAARPETFHTTLLRNVDRHFGGGECKALQAAA